MRLQLKKKEKIAAGAVVLLTPDAVSYTHLDVYKRQDPETSQAAYKTRKSSTHLSPASYLEGTRATLS